MKKFLKVKVTTPEIITGPDPSDKTMGEKIILERELDWKMLKNLAEINNGVVIEFDAPPEKGVKLHFSVVEAGE